MIRGRAANFGSPCCLDAVNEIAYLNTRNSKTEVLEYGSPRELREVLHADVPILIREVALKDS